MRPSLKAEPANPTVDWLISAGDLIREFLRQKRIAIVGVSRDKRHFSRMVFAEFKKRGYDVVPCNPHETLIDDTRAFPSVSEIQPPVDGVLIMTSPSITEAVVRDCERAGVKRVWFHRGSGMGSASDKAVQFGHEHDIKVIAGYCPLMFLSKTHFVHRLHGLFKRMNRTYPN